MPAPNNKPHSNGSVTLVGAGPDPELLTLRAVRACKSRRDPDRQPGRARILDFARREARKMMVGKTGYNPIVPAGEINAMMISLHG
jgi:uroporphyrin-III C-methyltransferase/precorrin-2 dehydrogenase/sirohydrochlorin ferrochelatase